MQKYTVRCLQFSLCVCVCVFENIRADVETLFNSANNGSRGWFAMLSWNTWQVFLIPRGSKVKRCTSLVVDFSP